MRFQVGDRVKTLSVNPPGHVRTPYYARGKPGVIERFAGHFQNPEELAYGRYYGGTLELFRVRFRQVDLWPDYDGAQDDTLDLEIPEHWLVPDHSAQR
ncbi:MAG: SH3-like domain-containing protein [Pseudomonadota bacterium]